MLLSSLNTGSTDLRDTEVQQPNTTATLSLGSVYCFPEFKEYFVHYPLKLSKGSSHDYAIRMAGSRQDVLDIGCGEGFLARELKKADNRITGIDELPAASETSALDAY